MKNIKQYIAWFAASVALTVGLSACQDDIDAPGAVAPVASLTPNTTLLELKQAYWDEATNYIDTIGTKENGDHIIIHGTVVSSDEQSNVFKSLVIQDETCALAFSINRYNLYLNYRVGQELVIDATGMYIGKYNGLQQMGYPDWYDQGSAYEATFMSPEFFEMHTQLNGFPVLADVDTIQVNSFDELPSNPEGLMKWQSQLVKFNNVEFANAGKETFSTYHSSGVNQNILDINGSSLPVRTSGYSSFWNNKLPSGRGDVVCILSYYGTTGWQLILNDYEGCMNFGNPTVAPGAESNPWTVDEAIALINGGKDRSGWVTGYIVGAVAPEVTKVTKNDDIEWTANPILDNTLVIGQTPDTKDIANAMVIELPYGTNLAALGNLVSNPANYGKQMWIRGNLAKYMETYSVVGNNGKTDWRIDGVSVPEAGIKNGDGTQASPFSANQVLSGAATGTAWVKGYIVGSSNGMSGSDFKPGAEDPSASNVFIANNPDETDYTKCVPIQLPVGAIRTAVSLQNHPENVGKVLSINGSIEKYFGQMGVKAATEYSLDGAGSDVPVTPPTTEGAGTETDPYTVATIIGFNPQSTTETEHAGVWVKGFIVGWANMATEFVVNANTATFSTPATLATNILVAASPTVKDFKDCIAVQLPSGAVRTALNLKDNPGNLGKEVLLKGDVMKYSGVPGLKNTSDYKLDGAGGGSDTPETPTIVNGIDQNFDASTSMPAGWTQLQVAGNKSWYVATFNGNNYAAMTGYKGTAPFDQWLMSPGVDLSKAASKVLTFDTQVNGYGSTTTQFEVYALNNADPNKASVKQKLNPVIATAPASGYSTWASSGNVDLSSFSGVVYIAFRYVASTDANYATWCVDNVKLNAGDTGGGDTGGGDTGGDDQPVTPPSGDYLGDFNSFNNGTPKSSPYGTYTNATGWTADNAIVLGGSDDPTKAANPNFGFIGDAKTMAPTLNGNTTKVGKLTSPLLTGGCGTLTFSYDFAFSDTKCKFTVTIKDAAGTVVKTDTVTLDSIEKLKAYSYSLDVNQAGDFYIEIVNDCLSEAAANKDRVSIWNLTWTKM